MGGKSRKTGGISKALIDKIKSGKITKGPSKNKERENKRKGILEE